MNNSITRHLAKILIHLAWCLQECISSSGVTTTAFSKAINALVISSVFLKFLTENAKSENFKEIFLSLDETEPMPNHFSKGVDVTNLIMYSVLNFVGKVDVSPETYLLHHDVLNFLMITMSTQLLSGPSPGPSDVHSFIDAAMVQETSMVNLVVRKLLLNFITFPRFPGTSSSYTMFFEGNQLGVLERVGSAAAHLMLLPLNFLVGSTGKASRRPLAECSLNVLLILVHYRKFISRDYVVDKTDNSSSESLRKEETHFSENPFCKAVENVRDIQCA